MHKLLKKELNKIEKTFAEGESNINSFEKSSGNKQSIKLMK